jgi:hypothetical protein
MWRFCDAQQSSTLATMFSNHRACVFVLSYPRDPLNAVDGRLTLYRAPLRSIGNQTHENLLLAQKIEVGVTAGARIDDGG